jgi:hypothetical protein
VLTRRIDQALEALIVCRERLPFLRDLYRPGSVERAALEAALEGLNAAQNALMDRRAAPGVLPAP